MLRPMPSSPSIAMEAEPFLISRKSKVSFEVPITITFHGSQLFSRQFTVTHFLCLCVSGGWSDEKASTADDIFPFTHYSLCLSDGAPATVVHQHPSESHEIVSTAGSLRC
uniref:Uncharacterized protein n=1 Tax=Hemiselmis andersenii TaxID=464988 RepID=A0A7S1DSG3_HEMAN